MEVDFKKVEERFDNVDRRFDKVDARLGKCDERLGGLEVSVAVLANQGKQLVADVSELKHDLKDLGTRMTDEFQASDRRMTDGFQASDRRMADGFQATHKELSSAKIWALLIAAAMLGVIARGFHWI